MRIDFSYFFLFFYRTQTKSNSDTLTSVSNKKQQRGQCSEKHITTAKTNKRKRDEDNILKNDMQSQCAAFKTEAVHCKSNNQTVPESITVNRLLRSRAISQTDTLSKERQSVEKVSSEKHNRKCKSNDCLDYLSDCAVSHATQSRSERKTVGVDVPSQKRYAIDLLVDS